MILHEKYIYIIYFGFYRIIQWWWWRCYLMMMLSSYDLYLHFKETFPSLCILKYLLLEAYSNRKVKYWSIFHLTSYKTQQKQKPSVYSWYIVYIKDTCTLGKTPKKIGHIIFSQKNQNITWIFKQQVIMWQHYQILLYLLSLKFSFIILSTKYRQLTDIFSFIF